MLMRVRQFFEESLSKLPWGLLGFMVGQLILSRLGASLMSRFSASTVREKIIPVWPPSGSFLVWVDRVWFAPLERWDTVHYLSIVEQGYGKYNGTAQFHPLFPWLASLLHNIGVPALASLCWVAFVSLVGLALALWYLARLDHTITVSELSVLLLVASPFAFSLFLPYSESLFLFCSVLVLYWARLKRWWLAGLFGALAALTRQQGVFLALPLALEIMGTVDRRPSSDHRIEDIQPWRGRLRCWVSDVRRIPIHAFIALMLLPVGYSLWVGYRACALGDLSFDFTNLKSFIYSVLISPSSSQIVASQGFIAPWIAIFRGLHKLFTAPDLDIVVNAIGSLYFLILLILSWRFMRFSYRGYVLLNTLVSFSYHTGDYHPYMGLLRHLVLGFPVFIGAAAYVDHKGGRFLLIIVGLLGFYGLFMLHILNARVA